MSDSVPPTLEICPACGGGEGRNACGWCFGLGLIDGRQRENWKRWREMQRRESSTHSILAGIVENILQRLRDSPRPGASAWRIKGEDLLQAWHDASDEQRPAAASSLMDFHRRALEFLTHPE